ncbi:hypothetical protein Tco_1431018, partial [Tanacetum coccineum]
ETHDSDVMGFVYNPIKEINVSAGWYLEDVLPLDNNNSRSGLNGLDMLAVFDPWIKDDTGLVLCDGPRHVSQSDYLEVTWMYWSMEDAKYKDVDSVLAIVPLNEAAIGLKESDKATDGLLNII